MLLKCPKPFSFSCETEGSRYALFLEEKRGPDEDRSPSSKSILLLLCSSITFEKQDNDELNILQKYTIHSSIRKFHIGKKTGKGRNCIWEFFERFLHCSSWLNHRKFLNDIAHCSYFVTYMCTIFAAQTSLESSTINK